MAPVAGVHWVGDFGDCACDAALLRCAEPLRALCERLVAECGLQPIGHLFHQFQPSGATGVVLLAESHLAVHTWPERRFVSVDLYVCNHGQDNTAKAADLFQRLRQAFLPQRPAERMLPRG